MTSIRQGFPNIWLPVFSRFRLRGTGGGATPARMKTRAACLIALIFTLLQLKKLSPKYYHVTGKWYLKRSIGDVSGHYTLVFRKINGRWFIISDHSS